MIKSCWDCILGNSRDEANDVVYGTQLNGDSLRAPPWPEPINQDEIMFVLPRKLQVQDRIHLNGLLKSNPRLFSINLVTGQYSPDYSNIACQFEALFPEDQFQTTIVNNGQQNTIPVNDLTPGQLIGGPDFNFSATIKVDYDDNPILDIYVGVSPVQQILLTHDLSQIRFLTLNGDIQKVNKLQFEFS